MYTLPNKPSKPILGQLGDTGDEGVVGVQCPGGPTGCLFHGALKTLQRIRTERETTFKDTLFAVASSSEEPSYSRSCLENLDIFPGVKMKSLFPYQQIGRTGKLTSRKTTHFNELKKVRRNEERSDEFTTLALGMKTACDRTFMKDAPPP